MILYLWSVTVIGLLLLTSVSQLCIFVRDSSLLSDTGTVSNSLLFSLIIHFLTVG